MLQRVKSINADAAGGELMNSNLPQLGGSREQATSRNH